VLEVSSFRSRLEQLLHEMKSEHHHGKSGQTAITLIPEISTDGTVLAFLADTDRVDIYILFAVLERCSFFALFIQKVNESVKKELMEGRSVRLESYLLIPLIF